MGPVPQHAGQGEAAQEGPRTQKQKRGCAASLPMIQRCALRILAQGHLDDLSEVQRPPVRGLGDLLLTAEAVGNDQCVGRRLADRGQ